MWNHNLHRWDMFMKMWNHELILAEPFAFGPWRKTETCSETCGKGKWLEQRSCTPVRPDESCNSLPATATLRLGVVTCGGQPCTGYLKACVLVSFKHAITGVFTKWSDWSNCTADCQSKNPNLAVMIRTRRNATAVETQQIRCKSPCPPGRKSVEIIFRCQPQPQLQPSFLPTKATFYNSDFNFGSFAFLRCFLFFSESFVSSITVPDLLL